jgi:hypothetical protein
MPAPPNCKKPETFLPLPYLTSAKQSWQASLIRGNPTVSDTAYDGAGLSAASLWDRLAPCVNQQNLPPGFRT